MIDSGAKMTPELLASIRKRDEQKGDGRGDVDIWPDMTAGVLTFFALSTQWKTAPMGGMIGLDYQAIRPTADLLGLSLETQAFHDIRLMEAEALKAMRRK